MDGFPALGQNMELKYLEKSNEYDKAVGVQCTWDSEGSNGTGTVSLSTTLGFESDFKST